MNTPNPQGFLYAYHGSRNKPFRKFSPLQVGKGVVGCGKPGVVFFTSSFENARFYADEDTGHVALYRLKLENPVVTNNILDFRKELDNGFPLESNAIIGKDIYDGIVYSDIIAVDMTKGIKKIRVIKDFRKQEND